MKLSSILKASSMATIALYAVLLMVPSAHAQMDMDVMEKWMGATVIHWSVVGDFEGDALILNVGTSGYAPVKDHVEIGFDYTTEGNGGLVGTPTFTDSQTEMGAIRNGAEGCRAPTISGKYEHSTIESIKNGLGGQITMIVRTDYPAGTVPVACTGGDQASPKRSTPDQVEFIVPGIMLFAMGDQLNDDNMQISKDKSSLIIKRDGWTYTYTPTKVR